MKTYAIVLAVTAAIAGCASFHSDGAYLPKLPTPPLGVEPIRLTGSVGGKLVVNGGCVKLRQSDGTLLTVLWHHETDLAKSPRAGLINNNTGRFYPLGATVGVGGGYLSEDRATVLYPAVAKRCGGPYATGWFTE